MRAFVLCLLGALALAGCATELPRTSEVLTSSTKDAAAAASLISAYRASKGLSPVAVDPRLNEAAEYQARAVAAAGTLSHGNFPSRMGQFGIRGHAAENLSAGAETVEAAIRRWQASAGHNVNLLMPQARYIGLARADSKSRYGRYWALVLSQ
ncbi:CAP domain-containing protein [Microvirga thermotolerans]|uniref:CAP domain-containing protein n=1 Tax=Microvirga thermotolerans TaxID=2651334 RepID=A0A5P9JUW6_9HYPH|nr:CAP domain-containing protein [Microvirga thermotolerans]QFU15240.1 CAP domain-containing protein [Microvirga thermotolerans]